MENNDQFNELLKTVQNQRKVINEIMTPTNELLKNFNYPNLTTRNIVSETIRNYLPTQSYNKMFKYIDAATYLKSSNPIKNLKIPNLTENIFKTSVEFNKSMDIIRKSNPLLADSMRRTLELTKINNPALNNQIFQNLQNTFDITGLNSSKSVLKEVSKYLKSYDNLLINNPKNNVDISEEALSDIFKNDVNQDKNDQEFDEILNEIDKQTTPFTNDKLEKIFTYLSNLYESLLTKTAKLSETVSITSFTDLINKGFHENLINYDQKEILFVVFSVLIYLVSNKLSNK